MLTLSELSTCDAVVAAPLSLTTAADAPAGATTLPSPRRRVWPGMSASADGIPAGPP